MPLSARSTLRWQAAGLGMMLLLGTLPAPALAARPRLHACAYRDQYTPAELPTLAGWDLLVTRTEQPSYLAALLRGQAKLLYYRDLVFARDWLEGWEDIRQQEDWFVHDRALGYRLFSADFGNYLMDPGSGWGLWVARSAALRARALGYAGVFGDDCTFTARYLRLLLRTETESAPVVGGKAATRVQADSVLGIYADPSHRGRNWRQGAAVSPGPGDTTTIILPPDAPGKVYLDYTVSVYRENEQARVEPGGLVHTRWPIEWVYGVWAGPDHQGTNHYHGKGYDCFRNQGGRGALAVGEGLNAGSTCYVKYKAVFLPSELEARWQQGLVGILVTLRQYLGSGLICYNGVDRRGGDSPYAAIADAGMMEEVFHSRGVMPNWFDTPERWRLFLDRIVSYQKGGKLILVQSGSTRTGGPDDERVAQFCYASYLLGQGDSSSFNFAWEYDGLYRPPAWSVDLGTPRQPYQAHPDGTCSRRFEQGLVVVLPPLREGYRHGKQVTHPLGGRYRPLHLDGSLGPTVSEVVLPDATGAILLPE